MATPMPAHEALVLHLRAAWLTPGELGDVRVAALLDVLQDIVVPGEALPKTIDDLKQLKLRHGWTADHLQAVIELLECQRHGYVH